ncbi:uncharacterized protein BXIN_1437 [Babesia sp. Xinjiang]|uniref:uncharacterized protein n=1 Tax=Babesia sp. Xinjiang TaxID=462227 RepID=UPI000A2526F8|nr:uncharacterized protein BXIN_1437 [Babesia sp. Xinjiang]ORM39936.1 hypothetical protein BXIN_1437 [Babesia sp. Xinjiang]
MTREPKTFAAGYRSQDDGNNRQDNPRKEREMIPFFSNDEQSRDTKSKVSNIGQKESQIKYDYHKQTGQSTTIPRFHIPEVKNNNTMTYGKLTPQYRSKKPLNIDLAHLKRITAKVEPGSHDLDFFKNITESKCAPTEYNDNNSVKHSSNCTFATSVETLNNLYDDDDDDDEIDSEIHDIDSLYSYNAATPPQVSHWSRQDENILSSIDINRRLKDSCETSTLARVSRYTEDNVSVQVNIPGRKNVAYAFSKRIRSPDPSTIPVPRTQQ